MGLNRRNAIIGLGALAGGAGAIGATGAFTAVEAEREVSVETAGDTNALLAFDVVDGNFAETDGDDLVFINLDPDTTDGGQGLNRRARTQIDDIVEITNQGTETVDSITFEFNGDNDEDLVLSVVPGDFGTGTNDFPDDDGDPDVLSPGQSVTFGVEVDLLSNTPAAVDDYDINDASFEPVLTITAE